MSFENNVFINCPFDNEYFPLLRTILFTLIYLEFDPKISETSDSGANRLNKIKELIKNSKYSIHDLSRIQSNEKGYPRFNMPLECGIDLGCRMIGTGHLKTKKCLILETEKFRYQEFISDIAGNDIRAHDDDPQKIVKEVRDWLKISTKKSLHWASEIWLIYKEFDSDYQAILRSEKIDPHEISSLTFSDLIQLMKGWIEAWQERSK